MIETTSEFDLFQSAIFETGRAIIPAVFSPELMEAFHNRLLQRFERADSEPLNGFRPSVLRLEQLESEEFRFRSFISHYAETKAAAMVRRMYAPDDAFAIENWHTLRKLTGKNREITGVHYDFQTAFLVASAKGLALSLTHWLPTSDIDLSCPGLIVFDKGMSLQEIHQAAGEQGYLRNIEFLNPHDEEIVRFSENPAHYANVRPEGERHIIDLMANPRFRGDPDPSMRAVLMEKVRRIYFESMFNVRRRLAGRYGVTKMRRGDLLVFDSDCYHCSDFPEGFFRNRMSLDFRVVGGFFDTEETTGLMYQRL